VAGESYGIEVNCVREVAAFEGLTPLPTVPPLFAGLIVLRGELVAVVDLALLWRDTRTDLATVTRLVALGGRQTEFALLAGQVGELRVIDERTLEAAPRRFEHCPWVRGASSDGLIILDGAALLDDRRLYA
jgi:purine-binding chemotaxis protein CheW